MTAPTPSVRLISEDTIGTLKNLGPTIQTMIKETGITQTLMQRILDNQDREVPEDLFDFTRIAIPTEARNYAGNISLSADLRYIFLRVPTTGVICVIDRMDKSATITETGSTNLNQFFVAGDEAYASSNTLNATGIWRFNKTTKKFTNVCANVSNISYFNANGSVYAFTAAAGILRFNGTAFVNVYTTTNPNNWNVRWASPDGSIVLFCCTLAGTTEFEGLLLWNPTTQQLEKKYPTGHSWGMYMRVVAPDGSVFLSSNQNLANHDHILRVHGGNITSVWSDSGTTQFNLFLDNGKVYASNQGAITAGNIRGGILMWNGTAFVRISAANTVYGINSWFAASSGVVYCSTAQTANSNSAGIYKIDAGVVTQLYTGTSLPLANWKELADGRVLNWGNAGLRVMQSTTTVAVYTANATYTVLEIGGRVIIRNHNDPNIVELSPTNTITVLQTFPDNYPVTQFINGHLIMWSWVPNTPTVYFIITSNGQVRTTTVTQTSSNNYGCQAYKVVVSDNYVFIASKFHCKQTEGLPLMRYQFVCYDLINHQWHTVAQQYVTEVYGNGCQNCNMCTAERNILFDGMFIVNDTLYIIAPNFFYTNIACGNIKYVDLSCKYDVSSNTFEKIGIYGRVTPSRFDPNMLVRKDGIGAIYIFGAGGTLAPINKTTGSGTRLSATIDFIQLNGSITGTALVNEYGVYFLNASYNAVMLGTLDRLLYNAAEIIY